MSAAAAGGRVAAADIGDDAAVTEMARDVEAALGPVAFSSTRPVATSRRRAANRSRTTRSTSRWRTCAHCDRNLIGTMPCRAIVPGMIRRRAGGRQHRLGGRPLVPEVAYSTIN
jgi:hypothetical protein